MKIYSTFFSLIVLSILVTCSDPSPVADDNPKVDTNFTGTNFFIGDSHVQGWDLKNYFPGKKTENHGISGQNIWQINSRLEKFEPDSVDNLFIIVGTNDFVSLSRGEKASTSFIYNEILKRYDYLLNTASPRFKKVYMISLFPIGKSIDCPECKERYTVIPAINDSLVKKCMDYPNITFIDIQKHLMGADKFLKSIYSYDGVHIEKNGYDVLSAEVRPYVR
jgi:lysophospholipase L1-like esterase